MSDSSLPKWGTTDAERDDRSIQREWDRFAMSDHADSPEPHDPPPVATWGDPTTDAFAKRAFDSLLAFGTTTPGDAFAGDELSDVVDDDPDASRDD